MRDNTLGCNLVPNVFWVPGRGAKEKEDQRSGYVNKVVMAAALLSCVGETRDL